MRKVSSLSGCQRQRPPQFRFFGRYAESAVLFLVVVLVATLAHAGAVFLPFQWDDELILRDDNVRLGRIEAFLNPPTPRFLPWLTYVAQYQISGVEAGEWHAVNLGIHALNVGLVFLLLLSLLSRAGHQHSSWHRIGAVVGALVFAVHPVQTEAVFYVYQRPTLMAVGLALGAWLAFLKGRKGLSGILLVAAMVSKETVLLAPVLFWLSRGLLGGRWRPGRFVVGALAATALVGFLSLAYWQQSGETTVGGTPAEGIRYLQAQVTVWWRYLGLLLHILPHSLDHHVTASSWTDIRWWAALIGGLGVVSGFVMIYRQMPLLVLFGAAFALFLLPTSSLIPSQDLMFEHRLYGAMIGWSGLMALLVCSLYGWTGGLSPFHRNIAMVAVTGALMGLVGWETGATVARLNDWESAETLWRDTVAKSPAKYRPNFNLGVALMKRSPAEAATYLERAVRLDGANPMAYRSLGQIHYVAGKLDEAEALWERALALEPDHAETLLALGKVKAGKMDYFAAVDYLRSARALEPSDPRSYFFEARLNLEFGFLNQAIHLCEEGINRDSRHLPLRRLLVECMWRSKNLERAVELCLENLNLEETSLVYFDLAATLARLGRVEEALQAVEKGLRVSSTPAEAWRGVELKRSLQP